MAVLALIVSLKKIRSKIAIVNRIKVGAKCAGQGRATFIHLKGQFLEAPGKKAWFKKKG
jgi:hypothetical protein